MAAHIQNRAWGAPGFATERPFTDHRLAALALLNGNYALSRKAGQFLGQLAVEALPLSRSQADWLAKLLERADLPSLVEKAAQ